MLLYLLRKGVSSLPFYWSVEILAGTIGIDEAKTVIDSLITLQPDSNTWKSMASLKFYSHIRSINYLQLCIEIGKRPVQSHASDWFFFSEHQSKKLQNICPDLNSAQFRFFFCFLFVTDDCTAIKNESLFWKNNKKYNDLIMVNVILHVTSGLMRLTLSQLKRWNTLTLSCPLCFWALRKPLGHSRIVWDLSARLGERMNFVNGAARSKLSRIVDPVKLGYHGEQTVSPIFLK